jgi:hypothetical protein
MVVAMADPIDILALEAFSVQSKDSASNLYRLPIKSIREAIDFSQ